MYRSTCILIVLAVIVGTLLCVAPSRADTWSLVGDFSSSVQGNHGWRYGAEYYYTATDPTAWGQFGTPATLTTGVGWAGLFSPGVEMLGSYGDGGAAIIYTEALTTASRSNGYYVSGTIPAGKVAFWTGGGGSNNVKARWVAPADGDYTFNVTFTGIGDSINGVYVDWANPLTAGTTQDPHTKTILVTEQYLSYANPVVQFIGSKHLSQGQYLEFVVDAKASDGNAAFYEWVAVPVIGGIQPLPVVQVDATITQGQAGTTGVIAGVVKDTLGNVLAGATVQDMNAGGASATTAADGTYSLLSVPNGGHTIQASKAGYSTEQITVDVEGNTVNGDITTLAASYLRGTITDSVNLVPVAGATVTATGYAPVTTGADGTYTIQVSPGTYVISAHKANFTDNGLTGVVVARAQNLTGQDIALTPTSGAISGTVKDSGGVAISGATVQAIGGPSTTTAADGSYIINGVVPGSYTVQASCSGYSTEQLTGVIVSAGLNSSGKNMTLTASYISGTVTDAVSHAPISGATVATTPGLNAPATTAADGTYTMKVSPGTYTITASQGVHLPASLTNVVVAKGASLTGQNIQLAIGWDFASGFAGANTNTVWTCRYADVNGVEHQMEHYNFRYPGLSWTGDTPPGFPWFYGPMFLKNNDGGPLTTTITEGQWHDSNINRELGRVVAMSGWGDNLAAISRFTAPAGGVYTVTVRFAGEDADGSTVVPVAVRQKGNYIFGQFTGTAANNFTDSYGTPQVVNGFAGTSANSYADSNGANPVVTFSQNLGLGVGDTVDAMIKYPGSGAYSKLVQVDMTVAAATSGVATIKGTVRSSLAGNPPLAGATLTVYGSGPPMAVTTASDGTYSITVPSGVSYEVDAEAIEYNIDDFTVTNLNAVDGQTYTENFTLQHKVPETWDLAKDYSNQFNPNGQWSFLLGNTLYQWGHFNWFMGGTYIWGSGPLNDINFNGGWVLKNTTGAPITWSLDHGDGRGPVLTGYVEANDVMLAGGGGPTVRWTSPDQRVIYINLTIKDQQPTIAGSDVLSCGIFKNGSLLNRRSVQGFYGTAAASFTDRMGPSPVATYGANLLVNAGDTIDCVGSYLHDANNYWGGLPGNTAIALTEIITPGTGVPYSSVSQMKNLPVGSVCFLTTPTSVLNDLNKDHGYADHSFYIESEDRSGGMKCLGTAELPTLDVVGLTDGKKITLTGTVVADPNGGPGQKALQIDAITSIVNAATPNAIGTGAKTLSSATRPINELVHVWGKVVEKVANPDSATNTNWPWLYWTINDGGQNITIGMIGQQGQMGTPDLVAVSVNDYISVTGIATLNSTGNVVIMPWTEGNVRDYTTGG